jgi:ribosomal protein S18 acetylase RimI-like enzyme
VSVRFAIEQLAKAHKRADFTCGNDRIDSYFREAISQDVNRKYATCFVAREIATDRVAGFYTLSSSNVPLTEVPEPLAKKLPRYPTVPAVLIGWLGRHSDYAGQGLGEALLFDAIRTVATAPIGAHAIFADATGGKAAAFYAAFGFTPLIRRPHTLYLPMATALSLLSI